MTISEWVIKLSGEVGGKLFGLDREIVGVRSIDDQVLVAHNVKIGTRSRVIAAAEKSGSVVVGADCWIALQISVWEKLTIGSRTTIGISEELISGMPPGVTLFGNPVRPLSVTNDNGVSESPLVCVV